uniref:Uncharacterized protein n=1 Tax=Branchiostoma floridae TaxID=7739 RepID=C3YRV1_BRAFL|eukprot:XP_002600844.1 hypothetical protein BRAFLDRAFT_75864 [Branchiostoma floridae]
MAKWGGLAAGVTAPPPPPTLEIPVNERSPQHRRRTWSLKEDSMYTCGVSWIPDDHGKLAVWGGRDTPHSLEKAKQFQTIHPVCQVCKSAGVEERTQGKKKMKRRREAEDDN